MHPKYDEDFYGWAFHTANLLRNRKMDEVDFDSLIEEIEDMGRSEKRQLVSRLAVLIAHLLKWEYQPEYRGNSWEATIEHQRNKIKELIEENPSLKPMILDSIRKGFIDGKRIIKKDTLDDAPSILKSLPKECPYTFEQLMDEEFYPEAAQAQEG